MKNLIKKMLLAHSIRSFKVRLTLIFFSLIVLIFVLFTWYSQLVNENDHIVDSVHTINTVRNDITNSSLKFQNELWGALDGSSPASTLKDFQQDHVSKLQAYIVTLNNLSNTLSEQDINIDNDIDKIINDIDIYKTNANQFNPASHSLAIENLLAFMNDVRTQLDDHLASLGDRLYMISQNKNKNLKRNILLLYGLFAILFLGVVYYLGHRLTRDLRRISSKMEHPNTDILEGPLSSDIEEVNDIDRSFEAIKSKLREIESDLEEANKISEYKSVFLANMSYEIRTPLNSVIGMINMLKQSHLNPEQQIQLEIAEYSSEHVLQLANMILDNSKVEEGKVQLELSAIDLRSDLSKLIKVFEYQAWDKGLEFEYKFLADENQKFLLLGDLKRIKQILTNLMSNAIKFTNSGKVALTVDQTVGPENYQIVTFYVKDTGIGISAEKAKRIFKDTKENHLSIMDYYGGTGLGLTASCQLIELMGGELKLESKENEGSIFYFSIQLQKTLNLEREKSDVTPILLNQFDYKFTVLVAEDNIMNQKVIKFLLEQQGADCTFVKNGADAVKLFNILAFDMVFMDIFMPEMDGYEATKLIKKSQKYADHKIPIIAVSASAFEEDIINAKKAGIDDFLAKPIEAAKLKELLAKYAPEDTIVTQPSGNN